MYNEKSGAGGGTIRLPLQINNATMMIRWTCVSPDFTDIALSVAQCEYRPPQAALARP